MARFYIDFDSTVYDTDRIRNFHTEIISSLMKYTDLSEDEATKAVDEARKEYKKVFDICDALEEKFQLKSGVVREGVEQFLLRGKENVFDDVEPFLLKLAEGGHEINILTFTAKEFEYQMIKMKGSGLLKFVDNVFMCSQNKGTLAIDYKNGIFIDDNPTVLKDLFDAGVDGDRLIRMRRIGAGYSGVEIEDFPVTEVSSFDEIKNI